ncbi:SDR family oxidoreductase [Vibrio mediterranei]|jgi:NAD(P)-dependent dehydrogenase (short-subunit alcohol dehydrogenase family)|uniref:SDR family oxidoreductase n=1 Tax=Vibrio mediterranei TaxID=689 RepID=UPI0007837AC7|nr:SDR family oxidoreductase [Vibrio mediterranei]MCG9657073.1 SDR family oxidoreductase [Vibrio mediterranei]MCG9662197.1 SDR family oxidoreductase [Vibrio mediterranei]
MIIKNSVVLITSAGTSLGAMIALHFAKLGARIVLCDVNPSSLLATYRRCLELTELVDMVEIEDISLDSVESLFNVIESKTGRSLDVLVNHWTSLPQQSLTGSSSNSSFIQKFSMLASSLFMFGQVAAERMAIHQSGVIVNVVAQEPDQHHSDLDNTTSMVTGFTKSWAKELKAHNVRVGGVIPVTTHNYHIATNWSEVQDELTRTTEYIVSNDYFSGRVVSTEA